MTPEGGEVFSSAWSFGAGLVRLFGLGNWGLSVASEKPMEGEMSGYRTWLSAIGTRLAILLAFSVLLGLIGLAALYRTSTDKPIDEVRRYELPVVPVTGLHRVPYQPVDRFYGIIEPEAEVEMRFSLPGRIHRYAEQPQQQHDPETGMTGSVEVPIRENRRVSRGQTLAWLEPQRYEVAVRSAQVRVEQAQAAEAEAQAVSEERRAAVLGARVQLADAEAERQQKRQLFERNVITRAELERFEREWEKAEAMAQAAEALQRAAESRRDAATQQLHLARQALEEARIQTEDATLVAPWDGTIAAMPFQIGQMVSAQDTVIRLVAIDRVKLVLNVPQSRIAAFRESEGREVEIRIRALETRAARNPAYERAGRPRTGVVTMVWPAADPVTRLFRVEIELENADQSLAPGMMAETRLPGDRVQAVVLPLEAVHYRDHQTSAFFLQRGARLGLPFGRIGQDRRIVVDDVFLVRRVVLDRPIEQKDTVLVTRIPEGMVGVVAGQMRDLVDGRAVRPIHLPSEDGPALTAWPGEIDEGEAP